jgi:hypothetical protein
MLNELTRRLSLRGTLPEFHPDVPQDILELGPQIFAVKRGELTAVHNLSLQPAVVALPVDQVVYADTGVNCEAGQLELPALSCGWFR